MMPLIDAAPLDAVNLPERFAVVTLHRPSNVDSPEALRRNMDFLDFVADRIPIILPVHHRAAASLEKFGIAIPGNVIMTPPLGYLPFLKLVKSAAFGGIQEETVLLKKRCFTLRKNTERPVTIDSGSNVLIDLDRLEDRRKVLDYAANPVTVDVTIPPLWDGRAGERIADLLLA